MNYLIIGNGAAGTTAAQNIRELDDQGIVTMVTSEDLPFYSRVRLPQYIAGSMEKQDLIVKDEAWHLQNRIQLVTGTRITKIDFDGKRVLTDNNRQFDFDRLLLAMGSNPFVPPVKGKDKKGVYTLRSFADGERIMETAGKAMDIVVIGGGLLGLEAGGALIDAGYRVIVVEFFDRLLPRQLDSRGGEILKTLLEARGFNFRLGAVVEEITGEAGVTGIKLKSGEVLEARGVLFSAGVRSNLELVRDAGLAADKGIPVNADMSTTLPGVYAAGDVAQFDGINYCIWPEAVEQGRVAGINMAGKDAVYTNIPPSNRLKVAGIALASAGEIDVDNRFKSDIVSQGNDYRKIVKDEAGRMIGCIMIGDTGDFNKIVKEIKGEN